MTDLSLSRSQMLLLSGSANRALAEEVAAHLGQPLCQVTLRRFADGELFVKIDENVRGRDVYIVQPTNPPAENVMELLLLLDAARRASSARITCVMPYYGYSRQDRKDQPRVAIGAKLMANLIMTAGADRVLGIDFHQHALQGFFDIPVDHLYAAPVFVSHYRKKRLKDLVVVAPDVGSAKMARGFAKRLNGSFAIIDKRRPAPNVSEIINIVGDVRAKKAVIVDDIIDTGGTLSAAAQTVLDEGAEKVYAVATHGVFSGNAFETLSDSPLAGILVTDTIPLADGAPGLIRQLTCADILTDTIRQIFSDGSVSEIFAGENQLF
jgi:ribose-phosphate pyrophosphokinase